MKSSETIGKLAEALSKAQAMFGPLIKGAENPFFRSRYADLASVMDVIRGPLAENGLSFVQLTDDSDDKGLIIETVLMHSSGEWISGRLRIPVMKQDPQSYGSAISYCRRYSLQSLLGLAAEDDDAESAMQRGNGDKQQPRQQKSEPQQQSKQQSNAPAPVTEGQRKKLFAMMTEAGLSRDESTAFYKWATPATMSAASAFIENFQKNLDAWRATQSQPEPGANG